MKQEPLPNDPIGLPVVIDQPPSRRRKLKAWQVAAGIGGATLGIIVVVLIVIVSLPARSDKSDVSRPGTKGAANATPFDDGKAPRVDLSGLSELDEGIDPPNGGGGLSIMSRPPSSASNSWNWNGVQLLTVGAGSLPVLDGVALSEVVTGDLSGRAWTLTLPPGLHVVQTSKNESPRIVQSEGGFPKFYAARLAQYGEGGGFDFDRLAAATVQQGGLLREPVLTHCWGDHYWETGKQDAAKRHWRTAIRLAPAFAPSHLNLAYAENQLGNPQRARHELSLAQKFNVQDAFGIRDHVRELQRRLGVVLDAEAQFREQDYLPLGGTQLQGPERRTADILLTLRELAATPAGKAGCLNNLGVFLIHKAHLPELAVPYLQEAHSLLTDDTTDASATLLSLVISNLILAAEQANFPEARLYRRLQPAR